MSASFYDLPAACDACRTAGVELCTTHAAHRDLFNEEVDNIIFYSEGKEEGGGGTPPWPEGAGLGFSGSNTTPQNQVRMARALENLNNLLTDFSRTLTAINETLKERK